MQFPVLMEEMLAAAELLCAEGWTVGASDGKEGCPSTETEELALKSSVLQAAATALHSVCGWWGATEL